MTIKINRMRKVKAKFRTQMAIFIFVIGFLNSLIAKGIR